MTIHQQNLTKFMNLVNAKPEGTLFTYEEDLEANKYRQIALTAINAIYDKYLG